jgi:hypothetical protein
MNAIQLEHLMVRFRAIGFDAFKDRLHAPVFESIEHSSLRIDIYLTDGKLRCSMNAEKDVNPVTINMLSYHMLWQKELVIPDVTVCGISLLFLESRIRELDYIHNPFSDEYKEKYQTIQRDFTTIGSVEKRGVQEVYQLLVTKYWNRFSFGEADKVSRVREQVLSQLAVGKTVLLSEPGALDPWNVFQELSGQLSDSGIKRRKRKEEE